MQDGGTVSIDWAYPNQNEHLTPGKAQTTDRRRVCVVFPGLSGGSDRGYVKALVKTMLGDGYEVAVLHNRGVSQTAYTSEFFADLTESEVYKEQLAYVKESVGPETELVGVGISMGGNMIMRVAGEMRDSFPLKAIVSVNNPFDIWLSIQLMRGSPYEKYLIKELVNSLIVRDPKKHPAEEQPVYSQMI
jgi:uncharacterized protein